MGSTSVEPLLNGGQNETTYFIVVVDVVAVGKDEEDVCKEIRDY